MRDGRIEGEAILWNALTSAEKLTTEMCVL